MSDYLTSPVTPIVAGVVAVAILIAVFTKVASKRRKEQRERAEAERRAELQIQREIQSALDRKRSRVVRGLERTSASVRRPASKPAPGRPGFRTDRDPVYNDTTAALIATGILYDYTPYDSGSSSSGRDSSPSPSYDSGSSSSGSDSGSSFSSDSGGGGDF